jgi:hypothetical protein
VQTLYKYLSNLRNESFSKQTLSNHTNFSSSSSSSSNFRVLEQIGVLSQSLKQGFWAVAEHCNRVRASFQVSSLGP